MNAPARGEAGRKRPLVAHIIQRLDYGGMETMLVELVNRMGDRPYRHVVICLADFTEFRERIRSPAVTVYALGKRAGKDLPSYARLWRLLRRLRPAIAHTYNLSALDTAPLARLVGCRVVYAEHGWQVERGAVPLKYIRLRRAIRPFVDRFVAVSEDLRDWLRVTVGVAPSKLICIHNGISAEGFVAGAEARRAARRVLELPEEAFIVGTVARLDPVKAQRDLIDAFAHLRAQGGQEARLVLVGDGPERSRLAARMRELSLEDNVLLAGTRADVPRWLAAFDVFALPSRNEGVSIAALEAMAAALPVVATRVGGNPEVVRDHETGLLIAVGDIDALAASLARYRDEPGLAERHGAAGRARLQAAFSLDAMVENYQHLYDGLLRKKTAPRRVAV